METVGKAKQYGVMSLETSVDQLYGDTWTDEEKEAEVERLKLEQGVQDLEEPGLTMKAGEFETDLEEGENDEGKSRTKDLPDESKGVPGVSGSSKGAGTRWACTLWKRMIMLSLEMMPVSAKQS